MQQLPKAIFFDADGTLYDSNPLHLSAYKTASKELYDFDFTNALFETEILRNNKKGPEVLKDYGIKTSSEAFYEKKQSAYIKLAKTELKTMPGLPDFLKWCQKSNIRCFVVTMGSLKPVQVSLDSLKIDKYFERIISYEDVGNRRKPDAYPYELGLQRARITPGQAIAVEDTAIGITSAKSAGLRCIGMGHSINSSLDLSEADHIIDDYGELKNYLEIRS